MRFRQTLLALGAAAAVACLPLAGTSGAIVSPMSGTVAVNGQPVAADTAAVAGDVVSTGVAGLAHMVLPGGSLLAASNTNFRIETAHGAMQIRLIQGLVEVSGDLPVALATRTVVPSTATARFSVRDASGQVQAAAIAGALTLRSAHGSYTVPPGTTASFSDSTASASSGSHQAAIVTGVLLGVGATGLVLALHYHNQINKLCSSAVSVSCL